ncbi:MAG: hypothetical protein HC817_12755 [Saprospiraceae bacterium]|nr:hypothetical protein [Saprospiraceae bacterium]
MHLPHYFSYLLTGEKASEYTSIGCHTMLWDFEKRAITIGSSGILNGFYRK